MCLTTLGPTLLLVAVLLTALVFTEGISGAQEPGQARPAWAGPAAHAIVPVAGLGLLALLVGLTLLASGTRPRRRGGPPSA